MVAQRGSPVLALAALAAVLGLAALLGTGCGTDGSGVQSCRDIEEARCRRVGVLGSKCNVSLEPPYFTSGTAVDACIRYYDTACLHGLEVSDPGPVVVNKCVAAIGNGDCDVVTAPQSVPACAWLVPPAQADAAVDAPAEATNGTSAEAGD